MALIPHVDMIILGRDFLEDTGMIMNFRQNKVTWEEMSVNMKPTSLIDTGREASYDAMMVWILLTKKQNNCLKPMAIKPNQK